MVKTQKGISYLRNEKYLDFILEKISKIGYEYISDHEKKSLEKFSKNKPVVVPKNYDIEYLKYPTPTSLNLTRQSE